MNDAQAKRLALNLLRADTEAEVIQLLEDAGYWHDPELELKVPPIGRPIKVFVLNVCRE
jgi:hypothetical protein